MRQIHNFLHYEITLHFCRNCVRKIPSPFTARQRSGEGNVFSRVCLSTELGVPSHRVRPPTCFWTSLYSPTPTPPWTCSNVFSLALPSLYRDPPFPPHTHTLTHIQTCSVVVRSASGRLASYWNAFLFYFDATTPLILGSFKQAPKIFKAFS